MARHNQALFHRAVDAILWREWDAIGVKGFGRWLAEDEYTSYVPGICQMLEGGADQVRIARHLRQMRTGAMGLEAVDQWDDLIARRLVGLMAGNAGVQSVKWLGGSPLDGAQWVFCTEPSAMLTALRNEGHWSMRKRRLFCSLCCRRIWELLSDVRSRNAVEVAESYADGRTDDDAIGRVRTEADAALQAVRGYAALAALHTVWLPDDDDPYWHAEACAVDAELAAIEAAASGEADPGVRVRGRMSDLIRHVFGNPFRPYPAMNDWPATIVELAQALYDGQDCGFVLHDALVEAGHPDLASHFGKEQSHPKGCWALDLLLGKE
jgi:hypothetical protein